VLGILPGAQLLCSLRDRRLGALLRASVIDILGLGILIPLVLYMAERFGTPYVIAPVVGACSCQLLAAPLWGRLDEAFGRRAILMMSPVRACLILGLASSGWLLLSGVLARVMAGNVSPAIAYVAGVSTLEKPADTWGLVGAATGIGFTHGADHRGTREARDGRAHGRDGSLS
jgi:DHA1 family tetracycline resistance protein-like MFS transporter